MLSHFSGIQYAGGHLRELQKAFKNPTANLGLIVSEASKRAFIKMGINSAPSLDQYVHPSLKPAAAHAAQVHTTFLYLSLLCVPALTLTMNNTVKRF